MINDNSGAEILAVGFASLFMVTLYIGDCILAELAAQCNPNEGGE